MSVATIVAKVASARGSASAGASGLQGFRADNLGLKCSAAPRALKRIEMQTAPNASEHRKDELCPPNL